MAFSLQAAIGRNSAPKTLRELVPSTKHLSRLTSVRCHLFEISNVATEGEPRLVWPLFIKVPGHLPCTNGEAPMHLQNHGRNRKDISQSTQSIAISRLREEALLDQGHRPRCSTESYLFLEQVLVKVTQFGVEHLRRGIQKAAHAR